MSSKMRLGDCFCPYCASRPLHQSSLKAAALERERENQTETFKAGERKKSTNLFLYSSLFLVARTLVVV